jgi:prevent-host-death family protein
MDVGVRELRDGLSRHLAKVQEGHTLVVTEHGRPIAQIVPIQQRSTLDQLIAEGVVRPPTSPRRSVPQPVQASGSVSELVIDQRR